MENDFSYVPKFELGPICDSPGVKETIPDEDVFVALGRHLVGDWGEVNGTDGDLNWEAISSGIGLIISRYRSATGVRFIVFTMPVDWKTFITLAVQGPDDNDTEWD